MPLTCLTKALSVHIPYVSVALVIQEARRMRRIVLSSVACLVGSTIFFNII